MIDPVYVSELEARIEELERRHAARERLPEHEPPTEGHRQPTKNDAKPCKRCVGVEVVWRHSQKRGRPVPLAWPPERRAVVGSNGKVYFVDTFEVHRCS